ncbi:DNA replication protein DnaC [Dysgonomonas alginatilytica]|uniref:DNA replication protein DnaC n=1 Tax=Dysgonomonas alginatilytica TaxID=1605892 RepID=A0A2V3PW02_9BACT|nr:hypothetical protein [Dysgonomonas alginatilytica]PXV69011.1 DNA replication protein DnaC [Dysgonomonas alginatilytica]
MEKRQIIRSACKLSDHEITERKRKFLRVAVSVIPEFTIDSSNRQLITDLFSYFNGIGGKYNPDKGLWMYGDIGTGKSSLMRVFSEYMKLEFNGFKLHICNGVANAYSGSGDLDVYTYNQNGYIGEPVWMCFDELGRETIPANHFGTKLNVMQHILHVRYSLWQSSRLKTFVTTNCDPSQIESLYGDFIRDRIREMFNVILVEGRSRRQ